MDFKIKLAICTEVAISKDNIPHDCAIVFAYLCIATTEYRDVYNITPCKWIANLCDLSIYKVRKSIKKLRELELVARKTTGVPGYEIYTESGLIDCQEPHPPINGFGLTNKGFESETYQQATEIVHSELRHICQGEN